MSAGTIGPMAMLGLSLHLGGGSVWDPIAWQLNEAAGEDPANVATMVANTTRFYAPDPDAPS